MAADDSAELYVNDSLVGTIGSISNNSEAGIAQSTLHSFDILNFLHSGDNLVHTKSVNGPDSFANVTNATYSQNPAGVVFGGSITQKYNAQFISKEPSNHHYTYSKASQRINQMFRYFTIQPISEFVYTLQ